MNIPWQKKRTPDYGTILLAVLAGAGAGLAVGLLMAPKTGEKLRGEIGTAVDEYLDSARRKAGDWSASASNLAQRGLKQVQRVKDSAAVGSVEKQTHEAVDAVKETVESGVRKGNAAIKTGTRG